MNYNLKVFSYYNIIDKFHNVSMVAKFLGTKESRIFSKPMYIFLPLRQEKNFYLAEESIEKFNMQFEEINQETIKVLYGRS